MDIGMVEMGMDFKMHILMGVEAIITHIIATIMGRLMVTPGPMTIVTVIRCPKKK